MPQAAQDNSTIRIDVAALQKLSMRELCDFRDALHTLASIMDGFGCQPRFSDYPGGKQNGAGDLLDALNMFLRFYEQAAVDVATEAKPGSAREAEDRGWTLLSFAAGFKDDLSAFAVLAAEAARDEAAAKIAAIHQRQGVQA
jgi:hypothetical protein